MKTTTFSQPSGPLATIPIPHKSVGFTAIIAQVIIVLLLAALTVACERPVDPVKEPGNGSGQPTDSTTTKPGSSTNSQPGSGTSTQPGTGTSTQPGSSTSNQPNGSVGVFKTFRISWAPTDFQEIQFDAADKPVQYTSQALYNQGTGQVRRFVYQFLYGPDQRLNQLTVNEQGASSYVQYQYAGNQVTRTEEYSAAGTPIAIRTYRYSATNQLIQVDEGRSISKLDLRKTYQYDSRGNLATLSEFVKNPNDGTYTLEMITSYEDYDNQKHVENLLTTFPFLPDVTFRVNNYHTKVVRYKDGREISRDTYSYVYNQQGYPTQKVSRSAGGTLTATYVY